SRADVEAEPERQREAQPKRYGNCPRSTRIGSLARWLIGSLAHWPIGPLAHWLVDPSRRSCIIKHGAPKLRRPRSRHQYLSIVNCPPRARRAARLRFLARGAGHH